MYIKEFIKCELDNNSYYPIYSNSIQSITYTAIFFYDGFQSIKKNIASKSIQNIETFFQDGMEFNNIDISIDHKNNLVYLSEGWYDYKDKPTTPEIEELFEQGNLIKLCKINFLKYISMTKDNFFNLILNWAQLVNKKSPYILIFLNDKDWYDSLPFDTQEAMEQFIADHTQKVPVK